MRNVADGARVTLTSAIGGGFLLGAATASFVFAGPHWLQAIAVFIGSMLIPLAVLAMADHEKTAKYQDRTYFKECLSHARNLQELEVAGLDVSLREELFEKPGIE